MGSTKNEISINFDNDKDVNSQLKSARRENPVGVPRRSTNVMDGKVWTIVEDETLLSVVNNNKRTNKELNWSKIANEMNKYRVNSFFERTSAD